MKCAQCDRLDTIWGACPEHFIIASDPACESCGRRGRQMVTATIGGESFTVCRSCGDDAAEHGAEVTS